MQQYRKIIQAIAGQAICNLPANRTTKRRKLNMLHAATKLIDLGIPPGNKLEQLVGDHKGQHRIRINDQWRLCFVWTGTDASDVEIVDYH